MQKCPNCSAPVEDNYDACWSCQYSFTKKRILNATDFSLVCPNCNNVIEASNNCPHCKFNLRKFNREFDLGNNAIEGEEDFEQSMFNEDSPKNLKCIRCKTPLVYRGNTVFRIQYGLLDIFKGTESLDLYACPKCKKVEIYEPE